MVLSIEELAEIQEEVADRLEEILTRLNRTGKLEEFLTLVGMETNKNEGFDSYDDGKIVVIGATDVKESVLLSVAKQLGLDKDRFEFLLNYHEAKKYDYKKLQYAPQYRVVLFGPIPHSVNDKGNSSNIIAEMEKTQGYPRIIRLTANNDLKITKSNFKQELEKLIEEKYIEL